jgi:hypothetical protein
MMDEYTRKQETIKRSAEAWVGLQGAVESLRAADAQRLLRAGTNEHSIGVRRVDGNRNVALTAQLRMNVTPAVVYTYNLWDGPLAGASRDCRLPLSVDN